MFFPVSNVGKVTGVAKPTRSLSFVAASVQWLSMSDTDWGAFDRAKWTISVWIKRSSTGTLQTVFSKFTTVPLINIFFGLGDNISFRTRDGATSRTNTSNETLTDTGSFHNLVFWYDSANATAGLRKRAWLDGTELTWASSNDPTAQIDSGTDAVQWGSQQNDGTAAVDALLYEPCFFSSTNPTAASIYNGGVPVSVAAFPGLWSLLNTNATDALTLDYVRAAAWTNNNTVTKSVTIP